MKIEPSIYETNSYLVKRNPTIIEYSVFFGAIKIMRFLFQNNVQLTPSLWIYAIHSKNPEIIHFLEENHVCPDDISYLECFKESIKCHHNDFAVYFKDNYLKENEISNYYENEFSYAFHFYNYQFIPIETNEKCCFYYAIEYDHYKFVEYYKNIEGLNINDEIIQIRIFNENRIFFHTVDRNNYDIFEYLFKLPDIEIVNNCFKFCYNIKRITIPSTIKYIGEQAFFNCNNLTTVVFPSSVIEINKSSFEGCKNLKEVIFPSSIKSIGDSSFHDCKKIEEIILPSSVTYLGKSAFEGCESLTKVIIPTSITSIKTSTFKGCINLEEITIPSSIESIEDNAFYKCSKLKEMIIPTSVTSIGSSFVSHCSSLEKVILPSSLKNFGKLDFNFCSSLTEFTIPSIVTIIDIRAFSNCTSLVTIEIPSSVAIIQNGAFYNCSSLKKITIPPLVNEIKQATFYKCSSLEEVNIPPSVISIGFNAFFRCTSLVNITIPPSVKNIAFDAFRDCSKLQKITIAEPIEKEQKISISMMCGILTLKILILGYTCSGKSCIFIRFIYDKFTEVNCATIGVDFNTKVLNVDGNEVKLQIWDTAGIEKFHEVVKAYYHAADCIIVAFDLTDSYSFKKVEQYFEEIKEVIHPYSSILMGNKCDLEPCIKDEDIEKIEEKYQTKLFKVSAKNNLNIKEAFNYLAEEGVRNIFNEKKRLENLISENYDDDNVKEKKQKKCNIT